MPHHGAGVERAYLLSLPRVPDSHVPVCGTPARGEHFPLPGAPRKRLDGGFVLTQCELRLLHFAAAGASSEQAVIETADTAAIEKVATRTIQDCRPIQQAKRE